MAVLNFKGKTFVQNHHLAVKYHQLVPQKDKSLTDKVSLNDNLIIHGDNLKALKALLATYAGKIKCIYIDPPYNTGNENWVYNDNVNSPMMPRLKLLRELLREDGVIFVSIDDNEQHRFRILMDEVFGEENFIANIIWQKKYSPQNDANYFSDMHDFIVVYAKKRNDGLEKGGWVRNLIPITEGQNARYKNPDNDPRGLWKFADLSVKTYSEEYDYPITTQSGRVVNPPKGRSWMTSEDNFNKLRSDNRIWFGKTGDNVPSLKIFLSEVQEGVVPLTLWLRIEVGDNESAKKEIKEIFSEIQLPFDTPKPTSLIKRILQISTEKDSIILDSFAGSGTTANAVLELNTEEGNRKFILVECEDYADEITAERVRRVIKGVKNAEDDKLKEGLGGTFSYLELARYIFYTATGEEFDPEKVDEERNFIGESKDYEVYLFYKPDIEYLRTTALTLEKAKNLGEYKNKKRLVFAPSKYLDHDYLLDYRIDYCQLPFEIYKIKS